MMQRITVLLIFIASFQTNWAQPFAIGHSTQTFTDPARANRTIPVEIYYPATTAGNNTPVAGVFGETFPVMAFGHGFVMGWDSYQNIWEALVPAGYILIFPKTETGFSPSHSEFAKDLAFLIEKMQAENTNSSSIFFDKISPMSISSGHSMGGGAALLSSQYITTPHIVIALAPAETNPSAIAASQNISAPSLILAGANDCVTPPATNQLLMYQAMSQACRTYISISGASHCQFANSNFNCNFGELTCTPAPTINRAQQHAIQNRLLIPWLDGISKLDCQQWNIFLNDIGNATDINVMQSCTHCGVSGVEEEVKIDLKIYPNPFRDVLEVGAEFTSAGKVQIEIFDITGRKVFDNSYAISTPFFNKEIELGFLPAGVYSLAVTTASERRTRLVVKR